MKLKTLLSLLCASALTLAAATETDILAQLSKTADPARQDILLRELTPVATAQSIPVLKKLALQPAAVGHLAINALMVNPATAATKTLVEILPQAPAQNQPIIIGALGRRAHSSAVPALIEQLKSPSADNQDAALIALGKIPARAAIEALDTYKTDNPRLRLTHAHATASFALNAPRMNNNHLSRLAHATLTRQAADPALPAAARTAALNALVTTKAPQSNGTLLSLLQDTDNDVSTRAAALLPFSNLTLADLRAILPKLTTNTLYTIANAYGQNPAPAALPILTQLINNPSEPVRIAAIESLGNTNGQNADAIKTLVSLLAKTAAPEATAADTALRKIPGNETTAALRGILAAAQQPAAKAVLISILSDRLDRSILPAALAETKSDDTALRATAFEAVGRLATPAQLPDIIALSANVKTAADQRAWETTLNLAAQNCPPAEADATVRLLADAIEKSPKLRPALLRALANIDSPKSGDYLRQLLKKPEADARKETVRAIGAIRNELSLKILLETAKTDKDNTVKILALRNYLDGLSAQKDMPLDSIALAYAEALGAAIRDEEKNAAIDQLKILSKKSRQARLILRDLKLPKQ